MTTKTETVRVKIFAVNVEEHLRHELHRMASGYVGTQVTEILNKCYRSIFDGESRKKFLADGFEIVDGARKEEVVIELVDNSTVTIMPDYETGEMVFTFTIDKEFENHLRMVALRETFLNFLNTG